jgi:hypothetical protein
LPSLATPWISGAVQLDHGGVGNPFLQAPLSTDSTDGARNTVG